ncbi:MAG: PD40 domain-containing protein [Lentisphaeria bacterium]|nr:PD40 domain-containing protein [Lentisphaeria bacterium]
MHADVIRLCLAWTFLGLTRLAFGAEPRDAGRLFEEGKRLERDGKREEAQGIWRTFLQAEPESPRAMDVRNGCVLIAEQRLDKSVRHCPIWSPDGRRMLFGYGKLGLVELGTGTWSSVQIPSGPLYCHDWSPDGYTVAGRQPMPNGRPGAVLFERDTGEVFVPTSKEPLCEAVLCRFSPSGRRLLLSAVAQMFGDKRVSLGLAVYDLETRQITPIPWRHPSREGRNHASWAPDEDTIVFHAYTGANLRDRALFSTRVSAPGEVVQLTRDDANNEYPAVSPDGRMVAYTRTQEGEPTRLCLMRLDGSTPPMELAQGLQPAWRPDGTCLAYSTATGIVIAQLGGLDGCPVQLAVTRADRALTLSLSAAATENPLAVNVEWTFYDANSICIGAGSPPDQPFTLKPEAPVAVEVPMTAEVAAAGVTARILLVASDGSRLVRLFPMQGKPAGG